jgi:hypothetical protein
LWELSYAVEKLNSIADAIENPSSAIPDEPQTPSDLTQFDP